MEIILRKFRRPALVLASMIPYYREAGGIIPMEVIS